MRPLISSSGHSVTKGYFTTLFMYIRLIQDRYQNFVLSEEGELIIDYGQPFWSNRQQRISCESCLEFEKYSGFIACTQCNKYWHKKCLPKSTAPVIIPHNHSQWKCCVCSGVVARRAPPIYTDTLDRYYVLPVNTSTINICPSIAPLP